jgi:FkbM family methyltransferase
MVNYYSQHGEDVILDLLFKNKESGFFVEVGCIDGRRFSNTLTFEERGWKGLCIEAHSSYIELLKKNRLNSIVVHCAAAEKDEDDVPFYANSRGSLSTLDVTKENYFRQNYGAWFTGFEKQTVNKRRLDSIFRQYGIKDIDILSLDIEGYEIEALKGIDLSDFRPLVFVIESDSQKHEIALDEILLSKGYTKFYRLSQNIFYLSDNCKFALNEFKREKINVFLLHTQHPLDNDGDKKVSIDLIL